MNNPQIQNIVNNFVVELQSAWNQSVMDALSGVGVGAGKKGPMAKFALGGVGARAKGEKRTSEELKATKEKFVAFVKANPNLRIEQINKQLGTTTKDLALPIRQLIADGMIKAQGEKRSTTYKAK